MEKFVECKICGFKGKALMMHLKCKHGINAVQYKKMFSDAIIKVLPENFVGFKNVNEKYWTQERRAAANIAQKNRYTPEMKKLKSEQAKSGGSNRCIQYWINLGKTKEEALLEISRVQSENSKKSLDNNGKRLCKNASCWSKLYWIERYKLTPEEAEKKISEIQSKLSLRNDTRFLGKHHSIESKQIISHQVRDTIKRVGAQKWVKHFGSGTTSKSELEVFEYIRNNVDVNAQSQYQIDGNIVDIFCCDNIIIEYNGDFWHANPDIYNHDWINPVTHKIASTIWEAEDKRNSTFSSMGYNVILIWERDYQKNKQQILEKLKNKINDIKNSTSNGNSQSQRII